MKNGHADIGTSLSLKLSQLNLTGWANLNLIGSETEK
jgi:hypothetical protein